MSNSTSRRELIARLAACGAILASSSGAHAASTGLLRSSRKTHANSPRYFVLVHLRGGFDAVLTTDPKRRDQTSDRVDVPYEATEIVDTPAMPLGPHWKRLAPFASKIAIVHGVQVKTVFHDTGQLQTLRLKTRITERTPSIFDVLGAHRDGQPLSWAHLGGPATGSYGPTIFADELSRSRGVEQGPKLAKRSNLFGLMESVPADDLAMLADVFSKHAAGMAAKSASAETVVAAGNVRSAAELFRRFQSLPKPEEPVRAAPRGGGGYYGEQFQRAFWLLENDVARSIYIRLREWDSHIYNLDLQSKSSEGFTGAFASFLNDIFTSRNKYGNIADNTLILICSELGRFTINKDYDGKDHFPECPFVFLGPGIKTGRAYGGTRPDMAARPISLTTGDPARVGGAVTLDDIGATVLRLFGIDGEPYGYDGRALRFLEAT